MRWFAATLIGLVLLGGGTGCQCMSSQRVERELRAREEDVRELKEELDRVEAYNCALVQDLRHFRGDVPPPPGGEHFVGLSPVRSIALGRQTGGHSTGSCAGDDGIQVQVEPRDPEGHTVKVAGSLLVNALEINKEGLKKPISTWEVAPDQLRRAWKQGLLSSGYVVTLPWKIWPTTEKLRVVVQFKTLDGKPFEAEKDIAVHLPPPDQRRVPLTPEEPANAPELLPPPRPVPESTGKEPVGPVLGGQPKPTIEEGPAILWRPVGPEKAVEILRPTTGP